MSVADVTPVRKQITVNASQARAFHAFTSEMNEWWPRGHHIGKSSMKRAVLETKPNGRWYEIGEDGAECEWGKVLVWEPPNRFVLAWQIDGKWQYDANFVTELEVKFIAEAEKRTRVELEHRNLERFGELAQATRASIDSPGGWGGMMADFAKQAEGGFVALAHYFVRLIPPRPTFAQDMNEAEQKLMMEHVMYWSEYAQKGIAIAFGPVADPKGGYGIGIVGVKAEADIHAMRDGDPVMKSGRGFSYEIFPMPRVVRGK